MEPVARHTNYEEVYTQMITASRPLGVLLFQRACHARPCHARHAMPA